MNEFKNIVYEKPESGIARIWLNRADTRNAQDTHMLYEINQAYDMAMADSDVKVVILAAKGPHFSSGHDLNEDDFQDAMRKHKTVGTWDDDQWVGAESYYCREKELYEGFSRRWRDLAKPTIASVQGRVISGGLMLVWPCDFIIASDDASFQDNTMFMGIPGVEYFAHTWELGIRKAKEFLLTGMPISASEAQDFGMVNRVVSAESLEQKTLEFARQISNKPSFALKLAKDAINSAYSAQGFDNVQRSAFNAHHLAHTHYRVTQDHLIDVEFLDNFRNKSKV